MLNNSQNMGASFQESPEYTATQTTDDKFWPAGIAIVKGYLLIYTKKHP
jgi:hypothetical protein